MARREIERMVDVLLKQQIDTLNQSQNTGYISGLTTGGWTGTDYLQTIPAIQYPAFTLYSTGGGFYMADISFDEKRPWGLFQLGGSGVSWYATPAEAKAAAETYITANKGLRFVLFKALKIIEAEPVKTRVREL